LKRRLRRLFAAFAGLVEGKSRSAAYRACQRQARPDSRGGLCYLKAGFIILILPISKQLLFYPSYRKTAAFSQHISSFQHLLLLYYEALFFRKVFSFYLHALFLKIFNTLLKD